jgi:DNA-binding transcriptional regulator YiaG
MDKGLLIRELAAHIGVTEETVINWGTRGIKPTGRNMERVRGFLEKKGVVIKSTLPNFGLKGSKKH